MDIPIAPHPSQLALTYLPPPPQQQQNQAESYIGSHVTVITNCDVRYKGVIYYLNLQDSILGLQNVICYGTEGRRKNGNQVPPSTSVYDYIRFSGNEIKEIRPVYAGKPPRPSSGSKRRQRVPLITNEIPQATQDSYASLANGSSLTDNQLHSNPYLQPQLPGSYFYDPWSNNYLYPSMPSYMPYPYVQAPINDVPSPYVPELVYPAPVQFQSFFTTFPPVPISLKPKDGTRANDFEAMRNVKKYNLWGDKKEERPHNPYGPIARPVKHTEVNDTNPYQEVSDDLQ